MNVFLQGVHLRNGITDINLHLMSMELHCGLKHLVLVLLHVESEFVIDLEQVLSGGLDAQDLVKVLDDTLQAIDFSYHLVSDVFHGGYWRNHFFVEFLQIRVESKQLGLFVQNIEFFLVYKVLKLLLDPANMLRMVSEKIAVLELLVLKIIHFSDSLDL